LSDDTNEIDVFLDSRFDLTKQYTSPILAPNDLQEQLEQFLLENGLNDLVKLLPRSLSATIKQVVSSPEKKIETPAVTPSRKISEDIEQMEETISMDDEGAINVDEPDDGSEDVASDVTIKLRSMVADLGD
jgi:hypothetical protein